MRRITAGLMAGLLLILGVSGCSYENYVESRMPKEDRALLMRFMRALESEDAAKIEAVAGGEVRYFDSVGQGNKPVRRTSIREIVKDIEKNGLPNGTPPKMGVYKNLVPKGATIRFISYDRFEESGGFFAQIATDHQGTIARFSIYVRGPADTKTGQRHIHFFDKVTNPNLTQFNRDKYRFEMLQPFGIAVGIAVLLSIGPAIWFIRRTAKRRKEAVMPTAAGLIVKSQ